MEDKSSGTHASRNASQGKSVQGGDGLTAEGGNPPTPRRGYGGSRRPGVLPGRPPTAPEDVAVQTGGRETWERRTCWSRAILGWQNGL